MKKQNVFRVPNVKIGSAVKPVRFKLMGKKQRVRCATKGEVAFTIAREDDKVFVAHQRGNDQRVTASEPAQAFAKGVKAFWAMWG